MAFIYAGDDLLSHTLSRTVQSALRGLTSVFGMGTGGTPAVRSPQDQHSALSRQHSAKSREWNALNLSLRGASQVLRRVGSAQRVISRKERPKVGSKEAFSNQHSAFSQTMILRDAKIKAANC